MPPSLENRIVSAVPDTKTCSVRLRWRNGAETVAEFGPLVGSGVFAAFADPDFFEQVDVSEGGYALHWPGGLDFAADALWFEAHPEDNPFARDDAPAGRAAE
jgi:hypothetical protein